MLHSQGDCKSHSAAAAAVSVGAASSAPSTANASSYYDSRGCQNSPGVAQRPQHQQQQQTVEQLLQQCATAAPNAAPAAAAAAAHNQHASIHSRQRQLRPPPARYASTKSNLAAAAAGSLPQHTYHQHHHKWSHNSSSSGYAADETTCTCVLPRTSVLCRLLVAMTVLLVFVQAVSCGMFFCVTLPVIHSRGSFVEYQDLVGDLAAPSLATAATKQQAVLMQGQQQQLLLPQPLAAVPKLIPRVIHQTYRSSRLPASAKAFMRTWADVNLDSWQVRFYDDDAALTFVRREFPEYFEAYLNLPKDVERADFFRYMVLLRHGGAYADIDVECRQPLDSIIEPADTLLVGWDTEVANATTAAATGLARQRLVANWFFVAAAGHPVLRELCEHIARNAMSVFSSNSVRDTAERTGAGVWTDVVLRHALRHQAAKHDDPWKVRILPRVAFGVRAVGDDAGLRPDTPGVMVLHHFMSSWQVERHRRLMHMLMPLLVWGRPHAQVAQVATEPVVSRNITHFPVSVSFDPPFTLMTDLVGQGDMQGAADVSAAVTAHGTWQPGVASFRKPAVVDALMGALAKHSSHSSSSSSSSPAGGASPAAVAAAGDGAHEAPVSGAAGAATGVRAATAAAAEQAGRAAAADGSDSTADHAASSSDSSSSGSTAPHSSSSSGAQVETRGGVLVDVGSGQGFFSLAAAARGHRVVAFEASPNSLAAFKASIAYNGFEHLIHLHNTGVGAAAGEVCVRYSERSKCPSIAAAAARRAGLGVSSQQGLQGSTSTSSSKNSSSSSSGSALGDAWRQQQQQELEAAAAEAQLRRRRAYPWLVDGAALPPKHVCCAATAQHVRLSDVLRNVSDVAVLRVSAHGHEGFVLQGALEYLQQVHKPDVVYVEFWPAAMAASGYSSAGTLLRSMYDLGYSDIAHAGRVCDERWHNATQSLRLQGSFSSSARMALQQPTWCKLRPEHFDVLAGAADTGVPENVMFLLHHAASSSSSTSSPAQTPNVSSGSSSNEHAPASSSGAGQMSSSSSGSSTVSSSSGSSTVTSSDSGSAGAAYGSVQQGNRVGAASNAAASQHSRPEGPGLALAGSADGSSSRHGGWQPQQPL